MKTKTLQLTFLLFLSLFFYQKNYAQQEEKTTEIYISKNHRTGWSLFFTPEMNYRVLRATPENQWMIDPKNEIEIPAFSYSFGLFRVKQITQLLDVEFGISYSIRNIRTQKIDFLWNQTQLQPPGKIQYSYSFHYFQLPLKISFYLNKNQKHYLGFGLNLMDSFTDGGSHFAKIWNANGQFEKKEKIKTPFNQDEYSGGIFIFGGKRWEFKNELALRVEPVLKLSLDSTTQEEYFKTFFYSYGINLIFDFSLNSKN